MMPDLVRRREVWWAAVSAHHCQSKGLAGSGVPRRSSARRNTHCGFPRGPHVDFSNSPTQLEPEPTRPPPTSSSPSIRSSNRGPTGHHPANFGPTALSSNRGSLLHLRSCFLCTRLCNIDSGYQSQPVLKWNPSLESTVLANPDRKPSFSFSQLLLLTFCFAAQSVSEDAAANDFG